MRRSEDVLRSVKKYLSEDVIPGYEIRLSSEEGAWQRPFCRVAWSTPQTITPIGARQMRVRRTLQVVAWPEETDRDEPGAVEEARLVAERLGELFFLAFAQGLHAESYAAERFRAHAFRIPIWDYVGKGLTDAAGPRATTDFASIVEDPNVNDIEDPNTDYSRLVIADLRLQWTRSVAVPFNGPTVDEVDISPAP